MPTNPTLPMSKRFEAAQRTLDAIRAESGIGTRLRRVGYGEDKIAEGEAIVAGVTQTIEELAAALETQQRATDAVRRVRRQLEITYRDLVQLSKATLGDTHPWLEQAGVPRRRAYREGPQPKDQSLDGLLAQTQTFFAAARDTDEETAATLNRIGLGPIALRMTDAYIANVEKARANQEAAITVVIAQTELRAAAFETLDDWMRDFTIVARVALRDRPEWLAALGITPRGRPKKQETTS